ncbi:NACHT domain-containing protein [Rhodococcus opacus]|nr:NACHT domain-containing protein [Rhodococcus opacus]
MKDVPRLVRTLENSRDLARVISTIHHQPIFNHTEFDGPSDFESLYVQRTFSRYDDQQMVDAEELNPSTSPFRVVVMGNPGAGKSTFVQHFKKVTSGLDSGVPVVEIVCRHYVKSSWDDSIVKHAVETLNAEHSRSMTVQDFESMLLLGRVCLVFDGLDEITEQTRRMQMTSRIESIAGQYPVCSVLVTTRLLGYERAPLPNTLFSHVRLDEFDDEQFDEYCDRWFTQRNRSDLVDSFALDSESVHDLRYNPLMLSLLCALYREHGSLPTDRRGVYARCADLLFRRWDSHRQIEHAGAMPKYAERLMQEIARWVYTSASVQDGIEEQQLVRVLAHSLVDRDGFEHSDAERDSRSFVEFCAGRAWLLASFGTNNRGQRMFRFTHRTFLEYFAAESFVRRSDTQEEICKEINRVFDRDATSVVPELLIQAYDSQRDNGGPTIFKELLRSNSPNLLLLRLMEGIGMSSQLRGQAFSHIFWNWTETETLSWNEFDIVLSLNDQARGQLVRDILHEAAGPGQDRVRAHFLEGWAGLELSGALPRFHDFWQPIFDGVARDMSSRGTAPNSQAAANWLISLGLRPKDFSWQGWDAIVCMSLYDAVPGLAWWNIDARLGRGENLPSNPPRDEAILEAYTKITDGSKIPHPLLEHLRSRIIWAEHLNWEKPENYLSGRLDKILTELLLYTICAMHEGMEDVEFLVAPTSRLMGDGLNSALEWRNFKVQIGDRPPGHIEREARNFMRKWPQWIQQWIDGRRSFVLWPDDIPKYWQPDVSKGYQVSVTKSRT